jgi:hypothetical protein
MAEVRARRAPQQQRTATRHGLELQSAARWHCKATKVVQFNELSARLRLRHRTSRRTERRDIRQ